MTLKILHYQSLNPGPTLVMLGGVHGNEFCGTLALNRLTQLLDTGALALKAGHLIIIPQANPEAAEKGVRFVDRNLNRHLYPHAQPKVYEEHLGNMLCPVLEKADVLLDLHSYASQGGPFIFLGGQNTQETQYAQHLGVNHMVYGWQNAYKNADTQAPNFDADKEAMGTTEFARSHGALAITLECGHHHNKTAPVVGLIAAVRSLLYFDLVDLAQSSPTFMPGFFSDEQAISLAACKNPSPAENQKIICVQQVFYKEKPGDFARPWQHLDTVSANEPLALYEDGTTLSAPASGYVLLPKAQTAINQEWFYFGTLAPVT